MQNNKGFKKILIGAALVAAFAAGSMGLSQKVSALPMTAYESMKIFTDVVGIIQENYTDEVETKDLVYDAVKGMVTSLDPHSSFMTPEEYKEMQVDTKGTFGGIGIEIGVRNGALTVISPIEDTPAFKAGIQAGDRIIKIDDAFTKSMTLMQAVKLMRGKEGTSLTITIIRKGLMEPLAVTLVRDIIQIKSVKFKQIEEGFGYVRITQFQERTGDDLEKALVELGSRENKLRGLVLDLRNNPGGLLQQAVAVSDKFLDEGLIVYTKGRIEGQSMEFSARKEGTHPYYPIVVLINGGSASASEIVSGALQDHKRGVIIGTQSFGKGSVQTIMPLSDGSAVRLTTSKYYTPSGRSIQAKGIEPDIVVGSEITGRLKEKDLAGHLKGDGEDEEAVDAAEDEVEDEVTPAPAPEKSKRPAAPAAPIKFGDPGDIQYERAVDYLKSWEIFQKTMPAAQARKAM